MSDYAAENAPIIERGEGVFLVDTEGGRFYDGISSLWCNVHGHRHKTIDAAIRRQLDSIAHSTLLGLGSVPSIELAAELSRLTNMPHVFYADSGAAAVEIAMKAAFLHAMRTSGGRKKKREGPAPLFLTFRNAYHGDTLGAVSVGGIDVFHALFKPLLFEPIFAPSPHSYRWPGEESVPGTCLAESLAEFERLVDVNEGDIAAVIIEPLVQGAAGMITQPAGFLREIRRITRERGIILIADEVATGFGRTGKMFAVEHENVQPDVLVLGKGITGGYLPLSAALFSEEIYATFLGRHEEYRHFLHGHTYTGNALACAAALGSLKVFEEENTLAQLVGSSGRIELIRAELSALAAHPHVGEIRQCGMMVGIELVADKATKRNFDPALRMGHQVILEARKRGMIIRPLGDVVVFMPPLSSSAMEIQEMCGILREAIEKVI